MSNSPLTEAAPDSLDYIFSLDPLQLTDDHIERVVEELRAQRERWKKTEAQGRKPKAEQVTLTLDDLAI